MEQKKRIKKNVAEEWMPTQDELLEEAKLTEIENLKSLGKKFVLFTLYRNTHF